MALFSITCPSCSHTFYRVEVRCTDYPDSYACPICQTPSTKTFIEPTPDEKTAEDMPCCHGDHFSESEKDGCGSCDGCGS